LEYRFPHDFVFEVPYCYPGLEDRHVVEHTVGTFSDDIYLEYSFWLLTGIAMHGLSGSSDSGSSSSYRLRNESSYLRNMMWFSRLGLTRVSDNCYMQEDVNLLNGIDDTVA
jgi:hypothetical protein